MATPDLSPEVAEEALALLAAHDGNVTKAAEASGISRTTLVSRLQRARQILGQTPATEAPADRFSVSDDGTASLGRLVGERVRTLDDLIRVCEIDGSAWTIKQWSCTKWEVASKVKEDKKPKIVVTPLFRVTATMVPKTHIIDAKAEIAALIEEAKKAIKPIKRIAPAKPLSGLMLEVNIADLHNGKLAWARETAHGNYDATTAEALHDAALQALLNRTRGYRFDSIVLVFGNDLLHVDSRSNTTTAGTPQDVDSRYYKLFLATRRMLQRAIETCRKIAPVHVVMVPGNHDRDSVWHLGDSLACAYHGCADVMIDNEPTQRKYLEHGKVMLMVTHGDKGKRTDYPLLMATEQPKMFGRTVFREAHTGHLHQTQVQEWHGVRVRILPSLAGADAWHAENAYVGNLRAAEAFVWSADEGLVATAYYTVPTAYEQQVVA